MPLDLINFIAGELPEPYCFESFQRLNVDIVSRIKAILSTAVASYWNVGAQTPPANLRAFPWLNTTDGHVYFWSQQFGVWVATNPTPSGPNGERRIWTGPVDGTAAGLWSYDAGDGSDPSVAQNLSPTTGSFWTVDTSFAARIPLGVGTLPSTAPVVVGGTGGEELHTLKITETPSHVHSLIGNLSDPTNREQGVIVPIANDNGAYADTAAQTGSAGGNPNSTPPNLTDPHNTMPPWYGVYFIKRTLRVNYAIPG